MSSLELTRPASYRGGTLGRWQPAAAVLACARNRGVVRRPALHALVILSSSTHVGMRVLAYLHPLSRRATWAAASGGGVLRQQAAGDSGSRPARQSAATGYSDTDVEKSEAGRFPSDRRPGRATCCMRLACLAPEAQLMEAAR
jgi:hypothetical protein